MPTQVKLGDLALDVILKDIKNVHLSVHPPTGRVTISAPLRMSLDTIRVFAISKLGWIKQQQRKLQDQERETPREYLDRESHYVWGRRHLLRIHEVEAPPEVQLSPGKLNLRVRPCTDDEKRRATIVEFYRRQVRAEAHPIVAKWQPILGVAVDKVYIRQMKTKWGTSNPRARSIRLNTELAKKPRHCLEYVVVHELVHFLERHHGDRFVRLMDTYMPEWQTRQNELNRHPLSHQDWRF